MNLLVEHALVYGLTGICTGFLSGVLGIGGGLIVVPVLLYLFDYLGDVPSDAAMHYAVATSLAIMILTSVVAVYVHNRQNPQLYPIYKRLFWGIFFGAMFGASLAIFIPTYWIRMLLGLFILMLAVEMCIPRAVLHRKTFPSSWVNQMVSMLIGTKSGLLGIGGGVLIIPYLTYCGVQRRQTVGVAAMCTLTVAVVGTVMYMISGIKMAADLPETIGYIYWPAAFLVGLPSMLLAPVGARLTYVLHITYLKWAFFVVLVATAANLLLF